MSASEGKTAKPAKEPEAKSKRQGLPDIVIPYKPRRIWGQTLHAVMDRYRNVVLVAHRRFGKTTGLLNQLIKMAVMDTGLMPRYAYIAPFLNQAKMIAWEQLKYYTGAIPGLAVNNSEMYIELPSQHEGAAGARIYIKGADNTDSLRGVGWRAVILDEFSQMPGDFFGKVIYPALTDSKGKCFIVGTPNGEDHLYEMYQKALVNMAKQRTNRWYAIIYRVDETGIFNADEIAEFKEDMTDVEFRQEYMCDFTVSAYNVVIPLDLVTESARRILSEKDRIAGTPRIMGVDVARMGEDRTTIWLREGLKVEEPRIFKELTTMAVADQVLLAMHDWQPDAVFIDVGAMGAGVVDRLRQLGYGNIFEVPFGSAALDRKRYENIRAEMYFKAKAWMEEGGAIPNIPELKAELSTPRFKISRRSRIILESKDELKQRLGRSPDLADGFVLTFAKPVAARWRENSPEANGGRLMCNTEYSVLEAV